MSIFAHCSRPPLWTVLDEEDEEGTLVVNGNVRCTRTPLTPIILPTTDSSCPNFCSGGSSGNPIFYSRSDRGGFCVSSAQTANVTPRGAWPAGRKLSSLDQEYNNIDDGPGVPPMGRLFHYVHRSSIILSGGCLALIVLPWMSEVVASVTEQFLWVVPPSDFTGLILGETPSNESSESLIWVIPPSDSFSSGCWRDLTSGPCVCLRKSGPEKHKISRMGEDVVKYSYGIQLLDFSCIYDALHCAQHQFGLSVCCLI